MNYEQKFIYGDLEIKVEVEFSKRKHLSLIVYPDSRIIARAPLKSKQKKVNLIIQKKLNWITKKLEYFDKLEPILPPKEFVSGETHYFLGRPYRLKIQYGKKSKIKLVDKFIEIETSSPTDNKKIKKLMMNWYKIGAKEILSERFLKYLSNFLEAKTAHPELKFRKMKRRWGSCSNKNVIILNTELIKATFYSIDYIIVHELCHLIHHGHNKKFYQLLKSRMPDWKERKKKLERMIIM